MQRIRRHLVVASIAALLIAACGASPGASTAPTGSRGTTGGPSQAPGASQPTSGSTGGAVPGTARATITFDNADHEITGGICHAIAEGFSITVGGFSMPLDPPRPDFLGISVEGATADGTFTGDPVFVGVALGGEIIDVAPDVRVTLTGNRSGGQFEGSSLDAGTATGPISGSFSC